MPEIESILGIYRTQKDSQQRPLAGRQSAPQTIELNLEIVSIVTCKDSPTRPEVDNRMETRLAGYEIWLITNWLLAETSFKRANTLKRSRARE